ncbi:MULTISPECIES: hypothetical protein [unclassified Chryseobacterium]|uniref:hypothetical protein n=1 Tax=unclassified Chryseobacterium TaxID=2593645 RepID=UPI00103D500A|nr:MULTISPECIES: hypothetical protein [unclassified Chryseobacterium]
MKKTSTFIFDVLKNEINNPELVERYKISKEHFTITRKQAFSTTLLFMMNFLRKSLALEIENFAKHFKFFIGNAKFTGFSKSVFVQCRNKIQP